MIRFQRFYVISMESMSLRRKRLSFEMPLVVLFKTQYFQSFSHVVRFTGPRQTCFAASDVILVYGVTPA